MVCMGLLHGIHWKGKRGLMADFTSSKAYIVVSDIDAVDLE
jgi:hypothetical protein